MKVAKGSVIIGYVHPNIVTEGFTRSLANLCLWTDNGIAGIIAASNPRQHVARNAVITQFLEGPGEWLMWIDTDMTFYHDSVQRLVATAKKHKADMVAGLAFIFKRHQSVIQPNCFLWDAEINEFLDVTDYEPGAVLDIKGTGSAFVLIHRNVLSTTGPNWHQNWMNHPANDGPMGHDLAFFQEACVEQGYKLVYDTNVKTGHIKHFELDEEAFRNYQEINR